MLKIQLKNTIIFNALLLLLVFLTHLVSRCMQAIPDEWSTVPRPDKRHVHIVATLINPGFPSLIKTTVAFLSQH